MLTSVETASSSTIVPVEIVPSIQPQEYTTDDPSFPDTSSYTIGPLDPSQLTSLSVQPPDGQAWMLLLPPNVPPALLQDPEFTDGYETGYLLPETEEDWSIPQIVNWTYHVIQQELCRKEAWADLGQHLPAWMVGCVLGDLSGLAETEPTLALVGLAHLSFLLSFLTLDAPYWPPAHLYRADYPHREALREYRARVSLYREQGKSFEEAQQLALTSQERSA